MAGLTWQDINLKEQYLTVRRSVRYNSATPKHEIGSTKRKKVRIVDFRNALADILKKARKQQLKNRMQYGELYHRNFYREVTEKNRVHYVYYRLEMTEDAPELLGHSDVSTTMNVYAHATREAKRDSAKLLDKVVGMNEAMKTE